MYMAVLSTMKTEKYMRLNAFHDKKQVGNDWQS